MVAQAFLGSVLFACSIGLACPIAAATITNNTVNGDLTNLTSTTSGLMVVVDNGAVPTDCVGSIYGWMLIAETDSAMVSTTLSHWLSGYRRVTIYVVPSSSGPCSVTQVHPHYN